ncbi:MULTISPECIES: two-component regulator propeller domain-containing protein [unclassified Carboxylicivirga]|uniref:ligand-binding sensor domain-containing protein n=1 Tax=Carboxylicivirga TaxID=1628153 RepID=UPI003D3388D6
MQYPLNGVPRMKFQSYNLNHGLSDGTIHCFHRTSDGMIWIGTNGGMDLFTGHEFIPLSHFVNDSLFSLNTPVKSIIEGQNQTIWLGTWGQGLIQVDIKTGTHRRIKTSQNKTDISKTYINILSSINKQLWAGSTKGLVQVVDTSLIHYTFEEVLTRGAPDIRAIFSLENHLLCLFTHAGEIVELNEQSGTYDKRGEIPLPIQDINKVLKVDNAYWVATQQNGLLRLDENYQLQKLPEELTLLSSAQITGISHHPDYGLFIATESQGLHIINNTNEYIHIKSPHLDNTFKNKLKSLVIDREGMLWIGYYKTGFSMASYKHDGIEHIPGGELLPSSFITGFCEDEYHNIWVGTEAGMALLNEQYHKVDPTPFQKRILKLFEQTSITTLTGNKKLNQVYVGTKGKGFYSIDFAKNHILNTNSTKSNLNSNFIRHIHCVSDTLLYIAAHRDGLYKFSNNNLEKIHLYHDSEYDQQDFLHIQSIDANSVWLASSNKGMWRINTTEGTGEIFPLPMAGKCYYTCLTSDSSTYVASDRGLWRFNEEQATFELAHSILSKASILSIIEAGHHLWLSSNQGLYRYAANGHNPESVNSRNVQGKAFQPAAACRLSNGQLLFGGTHGFNVITPSDYLTQTNSPLLFLHDLKVDNTSIKPGMDISDNDPLVQHINFTDELIIPHHIELFSLRVNPIDYSSNEPPQVAYQLEDANGKGKMHYTNGDITFVKLTPGHYRLSIYPLDSSLQPIETAGRNLTIIKRAKWDNSQWFYILLISSLIMLILSIMGIRIRQLLKTRNLLQRKITQRTAILLSQKQELQRRDEELEKTLQQNRPPGER